MISSVARAHPDGGSFDRVVEAAGRALRHCECNGIAQALRREILELHIAMHQRLGDAKRKAVGRGGGVVGPPAPVERLAPRAQLAMGDDLDINNRRCIRPNDAGGSLDESMDMVAGRPWLELDLV